MRLMNKLISSSAAGPRHAPQLKIAEDYLLPSLQLHDTASHSILPFADVVAKGSMLGTRKLAGSRWKSRVSIGISDRVEGNTTATASNSALAEASSPRSLKDEPANPSGLGEAPPADSLPESRPNAAGLGCPQCKDSALLLGSRKLHRGPAEPVKLCTDHARAHLARLTELSASCNLLMEPISLRTRPLPLTTPQ